MTDAKNGSRKDAKKGSRKDKREVLRKTKKGREKTYRPKQIADSAICQSPHASRKI